MKKLATLKDIAAAAGVSATTVSLTLNGKVGTRVSAETVQRIKEIAAELHYQPDINAQRLKGKALPIVGVVIPNITNYFYSEMTKGIMDAGVMLGYSVILLNSENNLELERVAAETFISMRVAGVIVCGVCEPGTAEEQIWQEVYKAGIPVVKIDRCDWNGKWPCVTIDNYRAAYDSVQFLHRLGHRKIGLIAAKWDLSIMNDRERGYRQAVLDLGMEIDESIIYRIQSYELIGENANGIAEEIINNLDKQTAVLVIPGDVLAIECIVYWKKRGISIPGDISIMGFDNVYMGGIMEPSLTTINQPKYDMGKKAMDLLVDIIHGEIPQNKKCVYDYEIVERGSTVKKV